MVCMTPSTEGRIIFWPEAVQYLLSSYKQAKNITRAADDLRGNKQKPDEDEDNSYPDGWMMLLVAAAVCFPRE